MRFAYLIILFILPIQAVSADLPQEFRQFIDRFEQGEGLTGQMQHVFRDGFTGEQTFHQGDIVISGDKYLIRVDNQTIFVDGMISRVYSATENKVIISDYFPEEDEFAPSRFFSAPSDLYQVSVERFEDGTVLIELVSDDPFEIFTKVSITIDENSLPLEVIAIDQTENIFTTQFEEIRFMSVADLPFDFSYPESAEILDLRE